MHLSMLHAHAKYRYGSSDHKLHWLHIDICGCSASGVLASYAGVWRGRGERTPGTHCLRMRLISEISRKIGYFSNPPCNDDL